MQLAICWAAGLTSFGIEPIAPLKSLVIQAENDERDVGEMRDGVLRGLELSAVQHKAACENVLVASVDSITGGNLVNVVERLIQSHRPDLLWLDNLLSYLGGDVSDQEAVSAFLRNQLNPVVKAAGVGVIIVHHTGKPPKERAKSGWSNGDHAYAGIGSSDITNWARFVLVLEGAGQVFNLRASKRGSRLRWGIDAGGKAVLERRIAHSTVTGQICWREATVDEQVRAETETGKREIIVPESGEVWKHLPTLADCQSDPESGLKAAATLFGIKLRVPKNQQSAVRGQLRESGVISEIRGQHGAILVGRPEVVREVLARRSTAADGGTTPKSQP
jgi:hypothetical protein